MPSTQETTLQKIQREISEVAQREKELKKHYARSYSVNIPTSNGDSKQANSEQLTAYSETNGKTFENGNTNGKAVENGAKLQRAISTPHIAQNGSGRLFTQNPSTKGVMHRFIKSRGRLSNVGPTNTMKPASKEWTPPIPVDVLEPPRIAPGNVPRKNFVPVEVRLKKEFQEMQTRESELRYERQKSQPDLMALLELQTSPEPERKILKNSMSASHLNEMEEFSDDSASGSSSLKPAKSLAELCDTNDEDLQSPGSLTLIRQWESIIQKSQQDRT